MTSRARAPACAAGVPGTASQPARTPEHASSLLPKQIQVQAAVAHIDDQSLITFADSRVRLEIADDGVGFTLPDDVDLAATRHLGLLGMRERAEMLRGRLRIRSEPGRGTSITVWMPTVDVGSGDARQHRPGR